MDKLVLASRNHNKIKEMEELLQPLGIEVCSALDFPELEEVEEDQPTLEGNALKKAEYVHSVTGLPSLSDDTGLEVDALAGAPGVYSARYAGEEASYQDNVLKLLAEMKNADVRKAQFRTVMAFVTSDNAHTFEGVVEGIILDHQRGEGGFGYDPVFKPDGYEQTFAELESSVKNKISHRGRAIQEFLKFLNTG
ncbi:MAG: RdgB/HAM1 family non-canonical purine NTP pyrophosphatase [Balneolaceae bacterium]|nr:RdgB/HAM1 family non-canonical purine NTP pyrophosphatase [Balneolaceae bacterium]